MSLERELELLYREAARPLQYRVTPTTVVQEKQELEKLIGPEGMWDDGGVVDVPLAHLHVNDSLSAPGNVPKIMAVIRAGKPLPPIAVNDKSFNIEDGHHRYEAAKQLGLTSVPCLMVDRWEPTEDSRADDARNEERRLQREQGQAPKMAARPIPLDHADVDRVTDAVLEAVRTRLARIPAKHLSDYFLSEVLQGSPEFVMNYETTDVRGGAIEVGVFFSFRGETAASSGDDLFAGAHVSLMDGVDQYQGKYGMTFEAGGGNTAAEVLEMLPNARAKLRSLAMHEMTHLRDLLTSPKYDARSTTNDAKRVYYNDPIEVKAFMQQVVDDVVQAFAVTRVGSRDPRDLLPELLEKSRTWQRIQGHLEPETRKKMLSVVYTAIDHAVTQFRQNAERNRTAAVKTADNRLFSFTINELKSYYDGTHRRVNLYTDFSDPARNATSLYEMWEADENGGRAAVESFLQELEQFGQQAIALVPDGLTVNRHELRSRLLTYDGANEHSSSTRWPAILYVGLRLDGADSIGVEVSEDGKAKVFEGNDEAGDDTVEAVNAWVAGDKDVQVWASHDQAVVSQATSSGMLPANLYVSPSRSHAAGYWGDGRQLFTGWIKLKDVSQESDVDWRTIRETPIQRAKLAAGPSPDLSYLLAGKGQVPQIGAEQGDSAASSDGIARFVSPHGSYRYVLHDGGRAVAALQVMSADKQSAQVANVWVEPEFRRQGLASRLFERAQQDFKALAHAPDEHSSDAAMAWKGSFAMHNDEAEYLREVRAEIGAEQPGGFHLETRGVLAGAYRGKGADLKSTLTHAVECDATGLELRVLCGKVRIDSLVDIGGASEWGGLDSVPTCPTCAMRAAKWRPKKTAAREQRRLAVLEGEDMLRFRSGKNLYSYCTDCVHVAMTPVTGVLGCTAGDDPQVLDYSTRLEAGETEESQEKCPGFTSSQASSDVAPLTAALVKEIPHEGPPGDDCPVHVMATAHRWSDGRCTDCGTPKVAAVDAGLLEQAKTYFGVTTNWREAGYILPDGTMLDFSGRHQGGGGPNVRHVDHREIHDLMPEAPQDPSNVRSGTAAMLQFIAESGAIRVASLGGDMVYLNFAQLPTIAQRAAVSRMQGVGEIRYEVNGQGDDIDLEGTHARQALTKMWREVDKHFGKTSLAHNVAPVSQGDELAELYAYADELGVGQIGDDGARIDAMTQALMQWRGGLLATKLTPEKIRDILAAYMESRG